MRKSALSNLVLIYLLAGLAGLPAPAQSKPVPNRQLASKQVNERVESLLMKMTLDEKLGQLSQYSAGYAAGPGASNKHWDELVEKGQIGAMCNIVGAEAANHYQH